MAPDGSSPRPTTSEGRRNAEVAKRRRNSSIATSLKLPLPPRGQCDLNRKILDLPPVSLDELLCHFRAIDRRTVTGQVLVLARHGHVVLERREGRTYILPPEGIP